MATSIKLDADLKDRAQQLAGQRRRSPHWIMREAIQQYVEREESREDFTREALASWRAWQVRGRCWSGSMPEIGNTLARLVDSLKDLHARARIQARIARLADGNPGQSRNLTGGISELKVDVGTDYRVYFTQRGDVLIILLSGGSKAIQQSDIRKTRTMVKQP